MTRKPLTQHRWQGAPPQTVRMHGNAKQRRQRCCV